MTIKVRLSFLCVLVLGLLLLLPNEFQVNGMYVRLYIQFLILFIFSFSQRKYRIFKSENKIKIFIFYYIITIVEGLVIHRAIIPSFWFFVSSVIPIIVVCNGINTEKEFDRIMNVLVIIFGFCSVSGIVETFTGINVFDIIKNVERFYSEDIYIRFGLHRATGMMAGYTAYGVFLIFATSLTFFQMERHHYEKKYLVVYFLLLVNELCTLTRSTILLCFFVQIVLLYKSGLVKSILFWLKVVFCVVLAGVIIKIAFGDLLSQIFSNIVSMFVALLDTKTAAEISASFGSNATGIGHRMELYSWVKEAINGKYIFGQGPGVNFSYVVNAWFTKTSLENQYLNIYFHYGFLGLSAYIISCVSILKYLWSQRYVGKRMDLNYVVFWCLLLNNVGGFAYSQVDDVHIYAFTIGLVFAYNHLCCVSPAKLQS